VVVAAMAGGSLRFSVVETRLAASLERTGMGVELALGDGKTENIGAQR
jgi:hypothetical protein